MIEIKLRGVEEIEKYIERVPEVAHAALRFAVNAAALHGARRGKKAIRQQVNMTDGYLGNPANRSSRLAVVKRATGQDLEAVIEARERPTSLARFATTQFNNRRRGNIFVKVKAGKRVKLKNAFFVKLRRGRTVTEDNFNEGIAIRLRKGESVLNKRIPFTPEYAGRNSALVLLYGPSVQQVFQSVSADIEPDVSEYAQREFLRQYTRLSK